MLNATRAKPGKSKGLRGGGVILIVNSIMPGRAFFYEAKNPSENRQAVRQSGVQDAYAAEGG
jgi:hypothetical protein